MFLLKRHSRKNMEVLTLFVHFDQLALNYFVLFCTVGHCGKT